jgi:hypothetical protein
MPELVPRIGEGDRLGAFGNALPGEDLHPLGAGEPVGVHTEASRQFAI